MAMKAIKFRRRREGKTDYRKRLRLLLVSKPRLIVRKTSKNIILQIAEYTPKGDKILASAHTNELEKLGWKYSRNNTSAAYLAGLILGTKAKKNKINDSIVDMGLHPSIKGSTIYAAIKGVVDGGVSIPLKEDILPDASRISGKHIEDYAKKIKKENPDMYNKIFSKYIKNNADPEQFQKNFEDTKKKIKG